MVYTGNDLYRIIFLRQIVEQALLRNRGFRAIGGRLIGRFGGEFRRSLCDVGVADLGDIRLEGGDPVRGAILFARQALLCRPVVRLLLVQIRRGTAQRGQRGGNAGLIVIGERGGQGRKRGDGAVAGRGPGGVLRVED